MRRAPAWIINVLLWAAPLGGALWLVTWQQRLVSSQANVFPEHYTLYDLPPRGWWGLLIACAVVPLVLAIVSGRKLAFAAGLSLVLLVACAAWWHRSHSHRDTVSYNHDAPKGVDDLSVYLVADSGGIMINAWRPPASEKFTSGQPAVGKQQLLTRFNDRAIGQYARLTGWDHPPAGLAGRMGFDLVIRRPKFWSPQNGGYFFIATVPFWFLCMLFSIAPLLWLGRLVRRRRVSMRRRAGLCVQCGYDLRASTGRCPECGAGIVVLE